MQIKKLTVLLITCALVWGIPEIRPDTVKN